MLFFLQLATTAIVALIGILGAVKDFGTSLIFGIRVKSLVLFLAVVSGFATVSLSVFNYYLTKNVEEKLKVLNARASTPLSEWNIVAKLHVSNQDPTFVEYLGKAKAAIEDQQTLPESCSYNWEGPAWDTVILCPPEPFSTEFYDELRSLSSRLELDEAWLKTCKIEIDIETYNWVEVDQTEKALLRSAEPFWKKPFFDVPPNWETVSGSVAEIDFCGKDAFVTYDYDEMKFPVSVKLSIFGRISNPDGFTVEISGLMAEKLFPLSSNGFNGVAASVADLKGSKSFIGGSGAAKGIEARISAFSFEHDLGHQISLSLIKPPDTVRVGEIDIETLHDYEFDMECNVIQGDESTLSDEDVEPCESILDFLVHIGANMEAINL